MMVRTLSSIEGTALDVEGVTWRSRRLATAADALGFSLHDTIVHAGTATIMEYRHHVEAVYCVEGTGSIRLLPDGGTFPITPGTLYVLDRHDRHELLAEETLRLVCIFTPALRGDEVHDDDGAYPSSSEARPLPSRDRYDSRGVVATMRGRLEPVLHGGFDARGPLSRDELLRFESRGYVVLRGMFSSIELAGVRAAVSRVSRELSRTDPRVVRGADSDVLQSLFAFHGMAGPLADLARDSRLVRRAQQILGSEVSIHQSRIEGDAPRNGEARAWHSDFETWHAHDGMPGMRALSAMIALTPHSEANGPLFFMPGSHKVFVGTVGTTPPNLHVTSLHRDEGGTPDDSTLDALESVYGIDRFSGEPGDVLLFDCNLLHCSTANTTDEPRASAFVVYDSVKNRPRLRPSGRKTRPLHIASRGDEAPLVQLVRGTDSASVRSR